MESVVVIENSYILLLAVCPCMEEHHVLGIFLSYCLSAASFSVNKKKSLLLTPWSLLLTFHHIPFLCLSLCPLYSFLKFLSHPENFPSDTVEGEACLRPPRVPHVQAAGTGGEHGRDQEHAHLHVQVCVCPQI